MMLKVMLVSVDAELLTRLPLIIEVILCSVLPFNFYVTGIVEINELSVFSEHDVTNNPNPNNDKHASKRSLSIVISIIIIPL